MRSKTTPMSRAELMALPASVDLWPTAGRALGLGRSKTFELAARGEFPARVLRLGRLRKVPTADLLRALGEIPDDGGGSAA